MLGALRRLVVALVLVAGAATTSFASEIPALNGRVNDNAQLLSPSTRATLTERSHALEEKTTVQVVILTVKDLQGGDIKTFANDVFHKWKLGQKGKDNGLLVLYTAKEDRYRIEVGYGLEGAIPDGKAGDILRLMRAKADPKKASTHDFDGAFTDAIDAVSKIVLAEYAKDPSGASMRAPEGASYGPLITVAIIAFILGIFAGAIHPLVGAFTGVVVGVVVAFVVGFAAAGFFLLIVVGAFLGLIANPILSSAGGGGSSSDGGFIFSSGGDSSPSFSGGGGDSGGGGADC